MIYDLITSSLLALASMDCQTNPQMAADKLTFPHGSVDWDKNSLKLNTSSTPAASGLVKTK